MLAPVRQQNFPQTHLCPLCDSSDTTHYVTANTGTIYRCNHCQGMFDIDRSGEINEQNIADKIAIREEYLKIFSSSRQSGCAISHSIMDEIIAVGVTSGQVLDVGSGGGALGQVIRADYPQFQWRGIELSPDLYAALDADLRAQVVHAGSLTAALAQIPDRTLDAIVINHVLEHLPTPREDLRALAAKLRRGGVFFIEVPNEQWKKELIGMRGMLKKSGDAWFPGHINFFTASTLLDFLQKQGFEIMRFRKMTAGEYPALVASMIGGEAALERNMLARQVLTLLRLTRLEKLVGYGISLRVICRPSA